MDLRELESAGAARHPWELSRADFFCELLARRVLDHRIERVLDVGAGDAFFASRLAALVGPHAEIVCVDPNYRPEHTAAIAASLPSNVRLSSELPQARADLILLLDVLEHIEDDRRQLRAWVEGALAPGGFVLVSLPAWPHLYSEHDRQLAHYRRYTPQVARGLLQDCGLRILRSGGAFHSLLPVRAAQVALKGRCRPDVSAADGSAGSASELAAWRGGARVSRWVARALRVDNALSKIASERGVELPGLSWWALCQNDER